VITTEASVTERNLKSLPGFLEMQQRTNELFSPPPRTNSLPLNDGSKYNIRFTRKHFHNVQNFVEREDLLNKLRSFIQQEPRNKRKVAILVGQSGYGKTQLTMRYAEDSKDKAHSATFFIDASTASTINQSMAFILNSKDQIWDNWSSTDADKPAKKPEKDSIEIRDAVFKWLSKPKNTKWLMIFDNAPDVESITDYIPPPWDQGTIIITTQSSTFKEREKLDEPLPYNLLTIPVGPMDFKEADKLLNDIAGKKYHGSDAGKWIPKLS
jgi:hypothetical protein